MRDIKFRAWFPEEHYEVPHMAYQKDPDSDNSRIWHLAEITYPDPDGSPVYMQYTGLEAKNGLEIYEGDILEYVSPEPYEDDAREIYIVEWKHFGFEATWHHPHNSNVTSDGHLSLRGADEDMKIIGNIYENPELLEPSDE